MPVWFVSVPDWFVLGLQDSDQTLLSIESLPSPQMDVLASLHLHLSPTVYGCLLSVRTGTVLSPNAYLIISTSLEEKDAGKIITSNPDLLFLGIKLQILLFRTPLFSLESYITTFHYMAM